MKKRSKKAQITVFIIIGIVIVVLGASFFVFQQSTKEKQISLDVRPIYTFVQQCIDETATQAVFYISERGGYYIPPEMVLNDFIPYYLYEQQNLMPSKQTIEQQLSLYVNENLNTCINNFEDFSDFQVNANEIQTTTQIKDTKVMFDITYPLSVLRQEQTYTFGDFNTEVAVRLGIVYDALSQIMQEQIKDSTALDPHNIYEVASENNLNIKILGFIKESAIIITTDKSSKINNQDFIFTFANKYKPSDVI